MAEITAWRSNNALPGDGEIRDEPIDARQRKRLQNRKAQRTYREKLKKRIEALEHWREVAATTTSQSLPDDLNELLPKNRGTGTCTARRDEQLLSPATTITPLVAGNSISVATPQLPPAIPNSSLTPCNDRQSVIRQVSLLEQSTMDWPPPLRGALSLNDFGDEVDYGDDDDSGGLVIQSDTNSHLVSVQSEQIFLGTLLDGSKNEPIPDLFPGGPDDMKTPLHLAAEAGQGTSVQLLLDRQAQTSAQDQLGRTALHLAVKNNHVGVVQTLLARRSSLDVKDNEGQTALHIVVSAGQERLVSLLLEAGAEVEMKDNHGRTALHLAVLNGHDRVIDLLLNSKADVNARVG